MIKFNEVTKEYSNTRALNNFTWHVNQGEIHGLLGHNGSGKTTSFMIANRMIKFTSGSVKVFGKNVNELSSQEIQKIGLLTEQLKLYKDLTIKETLIFFCEMFGIKNKKEKVSEIAKKFNFDHYINKRIRQLSTGMYKKVAIALTLINDPIVVFLDEPFSGLDPVIVKEISSILKSYRDEQQTTFIVSSHNLYEIEEIADCITIMKKGEKIISEEIRNLYEKYDISKSFTLSYLKNHEEVNETVDNEEQLSDKLIDLKIEGSRILRIQENKVQLTDIYNKIYA